MLIYNFWELVLWLISEKGMAWPPEFQPKKLQLADDVFAALTPRLLLELHHIAPCGPPAKGRR
jgi:hypothetical protein